MTRKYLTTHLLAWVVGLGAIGCAGDEDVQLTPLTQGSGGTPTSGGAGRGGSGGTNSGTGSGGTSIGTGSGGTITGNGGSTTTTGAGGAVTTTGAGGSTGRGGSGGTAATGGTGGTNATGRGGSGGTTATTGAGGTSATTGAGGTTATGQGGAAGSTTCGSLGNANNGSGSFTFYFFGQGTPRMGPGGTFLTACGYFGSESGMTDTVTSIANTAPASNTYFAAIPGDGSFNTVNSCGACAQITNGGKSIIATIIDECPTGSNPPCASNPNGHLDLSVAAFNALGYSVGNPSNTTWSYVPCPVSGNVTTRIKSGNPDQIFIENSILAITGVSMNGAAGTHLSYGAWSLNGRNVAGQTLTLTDRANRTLSVVVSGSADQTVDTGKQFPRCQ